MVQANDLPGKVKDLQKNRSDKTVYIQADARARFSSVTDVMDNFTTVRVDQIGLMTEDVKDKRQGQFGACKRIREENRYGICSWRRRRTQSQTSTSRR